MSAVALAGGAVANTTVSGRYRLRGSVVVGGLYASRKVTLLETPAMVAIAQTWSDPATGAYSFNNIPQNPNGGAKYAVYAYDHAGVYDPEIKINVPVELMP